MCSLARLGCTMVQQDALRISNPGNALDEHCLWLGYLVLLSSRELSKHAAHNHRLLLEGPFTPVGDLSSRARYHERIVCTS